MLANQVEKITAVGNFVGDGTWVITHLYGTNKIYAYLITSFGIDLENPRISEVGEVIESTNDPMVTKVKDI